MSVVFGIRQRGQRQSIANVAVVKILTAICWTQIKNMYLGMILGDEDINNIYIFYFIYLPGAW